MLIGVDFDNTIVCYDRLFHHVAVERSLIPATLPADKESVRNYLREQGREDDWTELQGLGVRGADSRGGALPGCVRVLLGVPPAWHSGLCDQPQDSPAGARPPGGPARSRTRLAGKPGIPRWPRTSGLPEDRVFFAETKPGKLQRIRELGCSHYHRRLARVPAGAGFSGPKSSGYFSILGTGYAGRVPFVRVPNWEAARRHLLPRGARHEPDNNTHRTVRPARGDP